MRKNYGAGFALQQELDRRQRRPDASVIRNIAVFIERHIEVDANERAFAPNLSVAQIAYGFLFHDSCSV